MGLLDRFLRVVRSSLNDAVHGAEDPEQLLEQATANMQENLLQLRQAVAVAIATQKRSERQYDQSLIQAREFYNRAQSALAKGNEVLAREALSRRQSYLETAKALEGQLQQQQISVKQLKANMRTLESKIAQARTQKDMYIARARSAKASQRLNEMITQVNGSHFNQIEDKILDMEANAAAAAEFNTLSQDTLDQKFSALEAGRNPDSNPVDVELAALKARLNLPES
ncbi:phage shock protein a family protein [Leptolyngbya sp. Heron Island J]|uniref:PspA/IM30 family protein n=1 Tax=Leptolyngbya sp. Heron Island J TaxID=1385935 RepID=UPI0003B9AA88|nr:PspA/IM30 family protein [Leptolyngbya sp. Heron Island J]ESA35346.1 phage shock protein a family protein [Leptolyngbya sp. Heron Island J]